MDYRHIGPKKYQPPQKWIDIAEEQLQGPSGGKLTVSEDRPTSVEGCDILVADSFYWFGQEHEKDRASLHLHSQICRRPEAVGHGRPPGDVHALPAGQ